MAYSTELPCLVSTEVNDKTSTDFRASEEVVVCSKIKQSISRMVLSSSGGVMLVPSQAIGHLELQLLDALQFSIAKGTLRVHC